MSEQPVASLSPAALIVAVLALVVAGAGAGYTAATIGTSDLENGAVTTKKVKNGSLQAVDMVAEKKFSYLGTPGAPDFSNGGEGDCVWRSAHTELPGVARPGYRTDRFGTVHLSGVALGSDGTGGDGVCDASLEPADGVVAVLPAKVRPARTVIRPVGGDGSVVVAGKVGLEELGIPPGGVYWQGPADFGVLLDGISYLPASTKVFGPARAGTTTARGRELLKGLGLR